MTRIEFKPFIAKDDTIKLFADLTSNYLSDKVLFQMIVIPVIPRLFYDGYYEGDFGLTRYIGGFEGDVVVCNTHKCMYKLIWYTFKYYSQYSGKGYLRLH